MKERHAQAGDRHRDHPWDETVDDTDGGDPDATERDPDGHRPGHAVAVGAPPISGCSSDEAMLITSSSTPAALKSIPPRSTRNGTSAGTAPWQKSALACPHARIVRWRRSVISRGRRQRRYAATPSRRSLRRPAVPGPHMTVGVADEVVEQRRVLLDVHPVQRAIGLAVDEQAPQRLDELRPREAIGTVEGLVARRRYPSPQRRPDGVRRSRSHAQERLAGAWRRCPSQSSAPRVLARFLPGRRPNSAVRISRLADPVAMQRHPRHARGSRHTLDSERRQAVLGQHGPGSRDQPFIDHC